MLRMMTMMTMISALMARPTSVLHPATSAPAVRSHLQILSVKMLLEIGKDGKDTFALSVINSVPEFHVT